MIVNTISHFWWIAFKNDLICHSFSKTLNIFQLCGNTMEAAEVFGMVTAFLSQSGLNILVVNRWIMVSLSTDQSSQRLESPLMLSRVKLCKQMLGKEAIRLEYPRHVTGIVLNGEKCNA